MTEIDPKMSLNCGQLAKLIGPRSAGRPTNSETVRSWMLKGLRGVHLPNRVEAFCRVTTWAEYQAWLKKVAARREEDRQARLRAVGTFRRRRA
jgi:hypothetical protein